MLKCVMQCLQRYSYGDMEGRQCAKRGSIQRAQRRWPVAWVGFFCATQSSSYATFKLISVMQTYRRRFTEKPHVSHDVLSLTYRDGSTCPADHAQKMESVIAFVCDHGVFGAGQPEFVSSLGDCHFFCEHNNRTKQGVEPQLLKYLLSVVWKTQHACSTSSKGLASGLGVVLTAYVEEAPQGLSRAVRRMLTLFSSILGSSSS